MIEVTVLSILQGVAEFLPISSSGHLVLGKHLLGLQEMGMRIDIFLHVGTLLAVFAFYFSVIRRILVDREWSYVLKVILSAVPAGVVGLLFKDWLETAFASTQMVGGALIFTGLVLTVTRFIPKGDRDVSLVRALWMGLAQALAILPGVSRSGMTLAAARASRVEAERSAEFSFLMSAPPIAGAALLELQQSLRATAPAAEVSWALTAYGCALAAVVGYFSLKLLVRSLKGRWFWLFGPYCLLAGLCALFGASAPSTAELPRARAWFFENVYGVRPEAAERAKPTFAPIGSDRVMMDGAAVRKRVRVTTGGPYGTNVFVVTAFVPTAARGPVPAFLLVCNRDPQKNIDPDRINTSEFWPAEEIVRRGYAAVAFYNGEVAPDDPKAACRAGVFACFEDPSAPRAANAWGTLSAWAWGASRAMDWLETLPEIDARRVAVVGHSRGGKTALLAGVTDRRFALSCSNDSGCSGAKLNRMPLPKSEHIQRIYDVFPHWFCANYAQWKNRDAEVPHDQDRFVAQIAPRLVAIGSAADDAWAGPEAEEACAESARRAWKDPTDVDYHVRPGGHDLNLVDWTAYMDFADRKGWRGALDRRE